MKKAPLVVLTVLGLGGIAAATTWWVHTTPYRKLDAFARGEDVWEWMTSNTDDPRVPYAVASWVDDLARDPKLGDAPLTAGQTRQLDQATLVLKASPRTLSHATAGRVWALTGYEPALEWCDDRRGVALAGLRAVVETAKPLPAERVNAVLARMGAALELPSESWLVSQRNEAVVGAWLRFQAPATQAAVDELVRRREHGEPVLAHARQLAWSNGYEAAPGELQRTYDLLKTVDFPDGAVALGLASRFGEAPETLAFFRENDAWRKELSSQLASSTSNEAVAAATKVIEALGQSAPARVSHAVENLVNAFAQGGPMNELDPLEQARHPLRLAVACDHAFKPEDARPTIDALAKEDAQQLLGFWSSDGRPAANHVVARALVRADPAGLAKALPLVLDLFAPSASVVEANLLEPSKVPESDASAYRRYGSRLWEAVDGFYELDEVPAVAVPAMWAAVSSPCAALSSRAAEALAKKRSTKDFVHGLFGHLSSKPAWSTFEVGALVGRLTSRADAGPSVSAELELALKAGGGKPEGVPMIQKVVALKALAKLKTPATQSTVQKFAADGSLYVEERVVKSSDGTVTRSSEQRSFAELAKEAL